MKISYKMFLVIDENMRLCLYILKYSFSHVIDVMTTSGYMFISLSATARTQAC